MSGWDNEMNDTLLKDMIGDIAARIHKIDSAYSKWYINGHTYAVWVNASSLTAGVSLEIDRSKKNLVNNNKKLHKFGEKSGFYLPSNMVKLTFDKLFSCK